MTSPLCTYELYAAFFKETRIALRNGDAARVGALRAAAGRRNGASQACLLAVGDAEQGAARRSKVEVCRPLCTSKCERAV